jgi:hypothetical protein
MELKCCFSEGGKKIAQAGMINVANIVRERSGESHEYLVVLLADID